MPLTSAVADTSVLINLTRVDKLELLGGVFDRVYVHERVLTELSQDSREVHKLAAVEGVVVSTADVSELPPLHRSCRGIDFGEEAVLRLALRLKLVDVLVDDLAARRCARHLDQVPTGFLGVLRLGKHDGLIPAVRPLADAAIAAGYRIRPTLYEAFLASVGE